MNDNEEFLGSEYDNVPDLMGVDNFFGAVARLPKEKQAGAIRKMVGGKGNPFSSRGEMERKFSQLPNEIREGLLKKRLQLVDTRFYVIKEISLKQAIDMLQGTDNKNVGLANLANQKIEKDNWFNLSALRLLYAVSVTKERADFGICPPEILNGEFELEAGQKKIFGLTTNEIFDTKTRTNTQVGLYKIESPKIIEPQVEVKMPIKFAAPAADTSWLKVVFIGTSIIPW